MKNLICKTCGSNKFREEKEKYICEYCGAIFVKPKQEPKRKLFPIAAFALLVIAGGILGYKLIYSVKKDISQMKQSVKEDLGEIKQNTSSSGKAPPATYSYSENNPFADTLMKVEKKYGKRVKGNELEEALLRFHKEEMNKAMYVALDRDGSYALGFAYAAKNTSEAEKEARLACQKMKKEKKLKDTCIPFAINNKISHTFLD